MVKYISTQVSTMYYTHTHTHIYTHTHIHTNTYTQTDTHKHTLTLGATVIPPAGYKLPLCPIPDFGTS